MTIWNLLPPKLHQEVGLKVLAEFQRQQENDVANRYHICGSIVVAFADVKDGNLLALVFVFPVRTIVHGLPRLPISRETMRLSE